MEMAEEQENLAILIFNWEYNGRENLPGVRRDKEALEELLSTYTQVPVNNADNVLQELKYVVEDMKDQEFDRVHFHFSGDYFLKKVFRRLKPLIAGHGIYNREIEVDPGKKAVGPHGECVIGTSFAFNLSSVHDIKLELLKLNANRITVTLDCCRTVMRDANPVIELR